MALMKGPVFRVTGLPASQPDTELTTLLKAAIDKNVAEEEQSKPTASIAIVPSCYGYDEKAALVEFHGGAPAFLSKLKENPLGDWQAEMGDTDISFDQHFFGFTQLYIPKADSPVTADIIAITGLDGHAYGSWRGKGNLGRMWLRDFLSKDLPYCRTMIYGYNSKLSSHGIDTIMDYGRGLMEELKKIRNTKELRKRPLFFVAHSFGGIILAHCLVKAVQTNEDDHPTIASLHKATYGMLLFGIPHKGLMVDDIEKMLAGEDSHPRGALLRQIKAKSDLLALQLADFKNLIRDRKIVSFYETGQTRRLEFDNASKRWKRTGDFVTAVDTDSALLQLPDSIEDKVPIDADHSMIVKFDTKNHQGYSSVRDKLIQFELEAPGVVAARFSRPQNRPKPCLMVPFQRDRAFVGREDILVNLGKMFQQEAPQDHARVALIGLGGVGKSQIAIEYAYRLRELAPDIWVFWVHASNASRFEQAYRDIAAKVELPGRDDPKTNILRLVCSWLSNESNGRWLMIVDNADDDRVFSPGTGPKSGKQATEQGDVTALAAFLPQSQNGWILVTSRDLVAAMNLVSKRASVIEVEPMEESDALLLLRTRVSVSESLEEEAKLLVKTLECIPLAVTHAAAYMAVRERITVSVYLELFRESEENRASLLNSEEGRDLRRDDSVSDAVITTWQVSFDQIQTTKPEAAGLLSLMAMFHRQGIPERIVYDGRSRLQFEDAVAPLMSFSLIRSRSREQPEQQTGENLFEMHGLVQLATRKWLEVQGQVSRWQTTSQRIMGAAFPSGQPETWMTCRALLPHSQMVLCYPREEREAALNAAKIASNTGWYQLHMGEYAAAAELFQDAVITRDRLLGAEHLYTLTSVSNLGTVLERQGRYEEAEAMHRQALRGYKKVLKAEHPDILIIISELGTVLQRQGKYEEAEAMHRRALRGYEKVHRAEHPDTLTSISQLGAVLESQGKYEEAEAMHRRALRGYEKVLGAEHPDTLTSISQLGVVVERQGKYYEAEAIHWRALQGREKVLGVEHINTLTSVGNLGVVLERQGKYKEAEAMHQRDLAGSEKVLGAEHPGTLTSMANLASVFWCQGLWEEAENLQTRVLETRKRVQGSKHPETLIAMFDLAFTLKSKGRWEQAISLMDRCYELQEDVLGRYHPDTRSSLVASEVWRMENIEQGVQ